MIIENKEMRVIFFGDKTGAQLFRLVPGFNEVKKDHWTIAEKDQIFSHKIKVGNLVVFSKEDKAIEEMTAKKAVEVVKNLYDPIRLEELATSKKVHISQAAIAQLKKIADYGNEESSPIPTGRASHEDLGHNLTNDRE